MWSSSSNSFHSFTCQFFQISASVDLFNNNLTPSLFKWLYNYNTTLVYLDLSSNRLSDSHPDVFGNMSSLAHLDLSSNQLEGGIPDSFAKLCGLQYWIFRWNNISGHISNFLNHHVLKIHYRFCPIPSLLSKAGSLDLPIINFQR
ncbi:hypothetical protein M0R45_034505 [Rubus argutus]|uniref:Non-specific serine/threonine protein kinase n=1 Tax=Rubus argutus TaxID=59490 RepID=A0AAW1VT90_RUBAR